MCIFVIKITYILASREKTKRFTELYEEYDGFRSSDKVRITICTYITIIVNVILALFSQ